jgi:tetraacyldisaccharide-1-P 4'-kinase
LAKSKYFVEYIDQSFTAKKHFTYPDHFKYGDKEVNKIVDYCRSKDTPLITTSKDWVKLKEFDAMQSIPVFVQEVATQFLDDSFDAWILNKLKEFNG